MSKGRNILRKLFFPHPALVVLTASAAAAALLWAFLAGEEGSPGVYAAYTLSAYGLTLVCVRIPALARGSGGWRGRNPGSTGTWQTPACGPG